MPRRLGSIFRTAPNPRDHGRNDGGSRAGVAATAASASASSRRLPKFLRGTGSLGLTRSELDEMCRPSGLYGPSCEWDAKSIRRAIGDGKLAARLPGTDTRINGTEHECPICFLHYAAVNVTGCCNAAVCTECYLQIRPRRKGDAECPFCSNPKMTVTVASTMNEGDAKKREAEEQQVVEAQFRAGEASLSAAESGGVRSGASGGGAEPAEAGSSAPSTRGGFGSSLRQHDLVQRARSRSSDAVTVPASASEGSGDLSDLVALTPDDRRAIEADMAAQTGHAAWRRVEDEAARRRDENEAEYWRNRSGGILARLAQRGSGGGRGDGTVAAPRRGTVSRSSTVGGRGDWNRIVSDLEAMGMAGSVDGLVVVDAAALLAGDADPGSSGGGSPANSSPLLRTVLDESGDEGAAALGMAVGSPERGGEDEDGAGGLPGGARGRDPGAASGGPAPVSAGGAGVVDDDGPGGGPSRPRNPSSDPGGSDVRRRRNPSRAGRFLRSLGVSRSLNGSRNNRSSEEVAAGSGGSGGGEDARAAPAPRRVGGPRMFARGLREEEQIALAIALSLRDQRRAEQAQAQRQSREQSRREGGNDDGNRSDCGEDAAEDAAEDATAVATTPAEASSSVNVSSSSSAASDGEREESRSSHGDEAESSDSGAEKEGGVAVSSSASAAEENPDAPPHITSECEEPEGSQGSSWKAPYRCEDGFAKTSLTVDVDISTET